MKVRLGYACISKTIDVTTSSTYPYTTFLKEKSYDKLNHIIESNLNHLNQLLDYNIKNNIHFFRLSSQLIPLATIPDIKIDYITPFLPIYHEIASKIKETSMRVDFHPSEYCVLNSTKQEVVENAFKILEYHYHLLDALEVKNKILVLHIGSSVLGKKNSMTRFIHNFLKLPKYLQDCIVIENDDKTYTVEDCLEIHQSLQIPIVLDYHHYTCNPSKLEFNQVFSTWKKENPKVHFSSPKSKLKKEFRSHHDYINSDDFISFLEKVKIYRQDIDIMIEAKAKDEALFKLVRELKYKTDYQFIDDTTFIV